MLTLLLWASSALAADSFTFAPWSGASFTSSEDGGVANVAISTPLTGASRWTVDVRAATPSGLLTGTSADGDYSVEVALAGHNARDIAREVAGTMFDADDPRLSAAAKALGAWCETTKGNSTQDSAKIIASVKAATEVQVADWLTTARSLLGNAHTSATCGGYDDAQLQSVIAVLEDHRQLLAEAAAFATNSSTSPFDELAKRTLANKSWLLRGAGSAAYHMTMGEVGADGGSVLPQSVDVGGSVDAYSGRGFALSVGAGASPGWGESTTFALYVEGGLAWVSPSVLVLPSTSTDASAAKGAEDSAEAAKEETTGYYVVIEGTWKEDLDPTNSAASGSGQALVGLRPTATGIGISAGASFSHGGAAFDVLPSIVLSGEIPNLRSQ